MADNLTRGINRTVPSTEQRRYSSWGRTRSPKNILSEYRVGTNANGDAKPLNDAKVGPYVTENQRFLWVEVTSTVAGAKLDVIGSMHAGSAGGALIQQIDAATPGMHKIEIAGMDKIHFSASKHATTFFAACSSF